MYEKECHERDNPNTPPYWRNNGRQYNTEDPAKNAFVESMDIFPHEELDCAR